MTVRINHWCSRLLSYAGKLQLVKSVVFAITNYWMQIFLLPKKIIRHIESMCRRFIWAGNDEKSKRAPVAWDHVCDSIANGGRNIIALGEWNKATIGKLLWSLSEKKDKMWANDMYNTRRMYQHLRGDKPRVDWRRLMYINMARPRAVFTLWLENRGHLFLSVRSQRRFGRRLSIGLGWSISILIGMSILLGNKLKGRATKCAFSKLRWLKRFTTFGG
ncbi:uncharacterized protein LOC127110542 [Lathyrus oleraceus]|uniref:uncharacterized protein LOC127110542 n=1 Tax=Pisum sativum TaxID=3888 RepID=UPI0021CF7A82|nr:uncharacterized protein LOC127110542 [Pisum sativum]